VHPVASGEGEKRVARGHPAAISSWMSSRPRRPVLEDRGRLANKKSANFFPFSKICDIILFFEKPVENGGGQRDRMEQAIIPLPNRRRLNAQDRALRRKRIFARLRDGWTYDEIAREERLTTERVREIVNEVLLRRRAFSSTGWPGR
jgi:hypothetical protein